VKSHPFVFQQVTIWPPLFDKLLNIPVLCAEPVSFFFFFSSYLPYRRLPLARSLSHFTWSFVLLPFFAFASPVRCICFASQFS